MHKTDLLYRLETLPTLDLKRLARLYYRDESPVRFDYNTRIHNRAILELERRKEHEHETHTRTLESP